MPKLLTIVSKNGIAAKDILLLTILPIFYFVTNLAIGRLTEPFYLRFNTDAPYAYLGSALGLSLFQVPKLAAHPGTPLQMLGALLFRSIYGIRRLLNITDQPFPDDILFHSEFSLLSLRIVLLGIISSSIFLLGFTFFVFSKNYVSSLLLQVSPLFIVHLIPPIGAEFLLIVAATLLMILMVISLFQENAPQTYHYAIAVGAIIGFGIAVKFTFIPCLIFIFLVHRRYQLIVASISTALSFLVFTLPVFSEYGTTFSWLIEASLSSGKYVQGETGVSSEFYTIWQYLGQLFWQDQPIFFGVFYSLTLVYALYLVYGFNGQSSNAKQTGTEVTQQSRLTLLLGLILGAFWLNVGLSLLESDRLRYFVPSMTLTPLAIVLLIYLIRVVVSTQSGLPYARFSKGFRTWGQMLILVVCLALNLQQMSTSASVISSRYAATVQELDEIQTRLELPDYQTCTLIQASSLQRPSTHLASLEFASTWSGQRILDQYLGNLYPHDWKLAASGRRILSYDGQTRLSMQQMEQDNQCLLLRYRSNSRDTSFLRIPELEVEGIFHGQAEHLVQLKYGSG